MKAFLTALLISMTVAGSAAPIKTNELRSLAKLPTSTMQTFIGISSLRGYLDQISTNTVASEKREEPVLRRAVQSNPKDATAWCELGDRLAGRAIHDGLHTGPSLTLEDIPQLIHNAQEGQLTETDLQEADRLSKEAEDCYTKAIAAAPGDARAYLNRSLWRALLRTAITAIHNALDGHPQPIMSLLFAPDIITDFQHIANIRSDDPKMQEMAALWQLMPLVFSNPNNFSFDKGLEKALPNFLRDSIRQNLARLESIAGNTNRPPVAAAARNALGTITFLLSGPSDAAEKHLAAAVALDPSLENAWELLGGILVGREQFDKLATVCADRLKVSDTSRNRFNLAKACERLNQLDKADDQLDRILQRDPKYFPALAGKAALALRAGHDDAAAGFLTRAATLLDTVTDRSQRADFHALQAILAGLRDHRDEAERCLGFAFRAEENNKNARAVLRTIGY